MMAYIKLFFFLKECIFAVLSLHCCTGFSLVVSGGYALVAVCGGFSCCRRWALRHAQAQQLWLLDPRAQAQQQWHVGLARAWLRSMRDRPETEVEPVSPALAGRFFTTEPPGKPGLYQGFLSGNRKEGLCMKHFKEQEEVNKELGGSISSSLLD